MTANTTDDWPEGVMACYVTVGGTTVTLWDADEWQPIRAICSGCSTSNLDGNAGPNSSDPARWAQSHAGYCRALPKPN